MKACSICKSTDRELRPYGKGGAPICFPCMKADPAVEREAKRQFNAAMTRAAAESSTVVLTSDGPKPMKEGAA